MIKKPKSGFKKAAAIGLTSLALLAPNTNAQQDYRPYGSYGMPRSLYDRPILEMGGEKIIRSYLKREKIGFKMNRLLRFEVRDKRAPYSLYIVPDFQLRDNTIIEYWSPRDKKNRKRKERIFKKYKKAGGTFYPIEAGYEEKMSKTTLLKQSGMFEAAPL